ncbi:pyridoxine 5'-phosphate synthase [Ehrlichia chaffeensis str. Heartland]|uniref:Pyridoxine 5'-phosphate synthase n=1 Tax=Ehrlichia chaffeensis (strain ATCC CRL-10679 / Arkansas) TaxID=205920 RepID=PDXJ_EHRCR|nr:pyridoxine 5'-phosphate synthase [Ehrlichia chaffeensis]Q2GG30.1 RecName: Full=Pyridoxine 5'-phosphate synthase; Short=PNP synthase [Ehrlichia chaffeensis str. Arkansas]ABD44897.1 pyridoxal phosphate biosynthesis protein PdxJ [Ehrlichia chaffeensis str. Arkansas]AHX03862.1 pyridoxine 5'-phosphate synthase [Ehrlichia chaffeensis str. Heartland]AHX05412.1 pyridoxine 5'-phosphate synthase [Ehrlichia chaffeensis str. Jax]AHX06400.1 pyridoxine 5'-phosphate synthase [Ehrlichia chaffeensis str. Li
MSDVALGVNIDHVATLRNARNVDYPDIVEVANIAVSNGADFITVHLREDRRHIKDDDVFRLKNSLKVPLNLEIAPTDEMLSIAIKVRPKCVCLVPEKRQELTTEGGLDVKRAFSYLISFIEKLHTYNIDVTLFIEPDVDQIDQAKKLSADNVELHTGKYCNNTTQSELSQVIKAAEYCYQRNIGCHAGHGLNYQSAAIIAKVPYISALNIGHFLICESVLHGIGTSVHKMKKAIASAPN